VLAEPEAAAEKQSQDLYLVYKHLSENRTNNDRFLAHIASLHQDLQGIEHQFGQLSVRLTQLERFCATNMPALP
jgi:hypothetical protein